MPAPHKKHYHILGHKLVPDHTVLSDKETNELVKRYGITKDQLPKILDTDPAVIAIDAKVGQVVKILRKSSTAKFATAYRVVIASGSSQVDNLGEWNLDEL